MKVTQLINLLMILIIQPLLNLPRDRMNRALVTGQLMNRPQSKHTVHQKYLLRSLHFTHTNPGNLACKTMLTGPSHHAVALHSSHPASAQVRSVKRSVTQNEYVRPRTGYDETFLIFKQPLWRTDFLTFACCKDVFQPIKMLDPGQ